MCEGSGLKPQTLFLLQKPIAQAGSEWAALRFPCGQRGSYSCRVYKQTLPLVSFPCNSIHVRAFKLCPQVWLSAEEPSEAQPPPPCCYPVCSVLKQWNTHVCTYVGTVLLHCRADLSRKRHCPTCTHPSTSPAQQSMGYSSLAQLLASSPQPTGMHIQNFPLGTAVSVPRV